MIENFCEMVEREYTEEIYIRAWLLDSKKKFEKFNKKLCLTLIIFIHLYKFKNFN